MSPSAAEHSSESDDMKHRISTFLGEFRIMVPAQAALLGFQLTSAFSNGWDSLGVQGKTLNYAAVLCTAIALVFLLVPAQYHRTQREVEENESFLHFAAHYFGLSFLFVGIGLVLTIYLQGARVFDQPLYSWLGAGAFGVVLLWVWLAIPLARVRRQEGAHGRTGQRRLPDLP